MQHWAFFLFHLVFLALVFGYVTYSVPYFFLLMFFLENSKIVDLRVSTRSLKEIVHQKVKIKDIFQNLQYNTSDESGLGNIFTFQN